MGFKTVTFTNEVEKRTHVQGAFMGKYFGTINPEISASNFECYDIQIYQGEISYLKNEKEHPEIINETIYQAVVSETQLTQKSFENVLVNLEHEIKDYDSIKLAIKEPKLEAVQIYDVVKDGNQTFGTLTCLVSGYLLETHNETSEIQVETCDGCDEYWKECTCEEATLVIPENPIIDGSKEDVVIEETFWEKHFGFGTKENGNWNWSSFTPFSFGCLGLLGLIIGVLILSSFGLPGVLIGFIVFLIYALSSLTRLLPSLGRGWRNLLYVFLGLLLLGLSFNLNNIFKKGSSSTINRQVKTTQPENPQIDISSGNQDLNKSNSETYNDTIITSSKNSTYELDTLNDARFDINVDPLKSKPNSQNETVTKSTILVESTNNANESTTSFQAVQSNEKEEDAPITSTQQSDILLDNTDNNPSQEIDKAEKKLPQINNSTSDTDLNVEVQNNKTIQDEEVIVTLKPTPEFQNDDSTNSDQIANSSQKQVIILRQKEKKATEIMTGIIFHEGDIFICKGDSSTRYHFNPNCMGLSNCSTQIYQINIPTAEAEGRTLCKLED